jgi:hypothetical protein
MSRGMNENFTGFIILMAQSHNPIFPATIFRLKPVYQTYMAIALPVHKSHIGTILHCVNNIVQTVCSNVCHTFSFQEIL